MPFDATAAIAHARAIAFPRLVGTPGEGKAFRYVREALERLGLEVEVQEFRFSTIPYAVGLRVALIAQAGLLLLAAAVLPHWPVVSATLALGVIAVSLLATHWGPFIEALYDVRPRHASRNLIARRPNPAGHVNLVLLAHYDSKSQTLPIHLRVILYVLFFTGVLALAVLVGLTGLGLWEPLAPGTLFWASVAVALLAVPLVLNATGDRSPGALDNAAGVGILLELARELATSPPEGVEVHVVATGAEEVGLAGAVRFIQGYAPRFLDRRTYFINFDGPGAEGRVILTSRYGIPPVSTAGRLREAARAVAREMGIPWTDGYLPVGAGLDQTPIAARGFEIITIHSGRPGSAVYAIHSPRDTMDKVHPEAVRRCGELALRLAHRLPGAGL